ncbi:olfactory receptor 6-like [Hyla sarda]|uniref:olfactory receptor 6-like n=1 Tax=Hyla sarda TaxID=327740 RepID=UPI0024C2363C|nr:olfactory receptor 6-like [Hyla sarda]
MERHQSNNITAFILVGFPTYPEYQFVLFYFFLSIYILTVTENVVIIVTIKMNILLHKPMYYFLCSLSVLEICYVTVTVPNLLNNFLTQNKKIYFFACMAQLYIFMSLACTECFLLAVMAFDRYVAICIPLRYTVIMSNTFCLYLAVGSWVSGFAIAMSKVIFIFRLSFCGPNVINHFFCDISPVLNLACSDVSLAELVDFILGMMVCLIPLAVIVFTYICIIWSILKISDSAGRRKTFSTCASHLTVVAIFFSTTFFIYARPKKISPFDSSKYVSIFYSILTPLLNPIIYCLRNVEVKKTIKNTLRLCFK